MQNKNLRWLLNKIQFKKSQNKFHTILLFIVFSFTISACESFERLKEPKPLEGKDVNVYSLGDGQVEFRLKATGFTSTLWVTTELVNNSSDVLTFDTANLLQFEDISCLEDKEFEKPRAESLKPNERQQVHYTFKLYALQKHSPEYERCKTVPLKFAINSIKRNEKPVEVKTLTIEP
jgi:hypothetical protein